MSVTAGTILQSTAMLNDSYFEGCDLFIAEHNSKGSLGFIFNKIFSRKLNELEEFKNCPPFPLYEGGPVDTEHLYFLHQRPDLIEEGNPVSRNIFFGGNFKQAIRYIIDGTIREKDIKIFIGYCGWDDDELPAEIKEGSWMIRKKYETVF